MEDASDSQQHKLIGEKEYAEAIGEVIGQASRTLHIFDVDLSTGGYQSPERYEALRQFMARNRNSTLTIVLHETTYLERFCPRLLNLLKLYSHRISILQTHEHGRAASDPFVIADEVHYVHRFHAEGARAKLSVEDPAGARMLEERFQQLLETSSVAVSATTLGL